MEFAASVSEVLDPQYRSLRVPGRGAFASGSHRYDQTDFGRDQIIASLHMLRIDPSLAYDVINSLSRRIGREYDPVTGEQPGGILHEARSRVINGKRSSFDYQVIMAAIRKEYGGTRQEVIQYNTCDAPPLLLRLIHEVSNIYGPGILSHTVQTSNGELEEVTIKEVVSMLGKWVARNTDRYGNGILEYKKDNAVDNPVAADSSTSYLFRDNAGKPQLPNPFEPRSSIELSGYAIDAFLGAHELLGGGGPTPEGKTWLEYAQRCQTQSFEIFWRENQVAMGTHRTSSGEIALLPTRSSLPALTLDSKLYDGLDPDEYLRRIVPVIELPFHPSIITKVGPRFTQVEDAGLTSFIRYWGPHKSWPVITLKIAIGLDRHGLQQAAEHLYIQLLNSLLVAGRDQENFTILPNGTVIYYPMSITEALADRSRKRIQPPLFDTNFPESPQLWTTTARLYATDRLQNPGKYLSVWQEINSNRPSLINDKIREVEKRVLSRVKRVHIYSKAEAEMIYRKQPKVVFDERPAVDQEKALYQQLLAEISG